MESINIFKLFIVTNLLLWIFLFAVTLFMGNPAILRKRGYSEEYISFMKRDYTIRAVSMAIILPLLQVAAYFIGSLFIDDISSRAEIVALIFLLMIIPFPVIDNIITGRKLRQVGERSDEPMVIDLKHKVLNLVFNPLLELVLALVTLAYALFFIRPFILFYLHLILPWIFYLTVRGAAKTVRPHLRDGYLWAFVFIMINFALVIYYLVDGLVKGASSSFSAEPALGIIIIIVLSGRLLLYIFNYPKFSMKLKGK